MKNFEKSAVVFVIALLFGCSNGSDTRFSFYFPPALSGNQDSVLASHTFSEPDTYFPVVRVTTQREGEPADTYARVQNIARVRVVVTA